MSKVYILKKGGQFLYNFAIGEETFPLWSADICSAKPFSEEEAKRLESKVKGEAVEVDEETIRR